MGQRTEQAQTERTTPTSVALGVQRQLEIDGAGTVEESANAQHVARRVYGQVAKFLGLGVLALAFIAQEPCPNPADSSPAPHCDRRNEEAQ